MYLLGIGAASDEYGAARLLLTAVKQGNETEHADPSWCYQYGMGVEQDYHQAFV